MHAQSVGVPGNPYPTDHGLLNRDLMMCHTLYYPRGLDGSIGDLLLLPGIMIASVTVLCPAETAMAS